jgi:hypothetical protein
MRNRAMKIGVLCGWITALMTLGIDLPGRQTENVVYVITVTLTILQRTTPGPNTKRMANIWYAQGVHDTLKRVQPDRDGAESPSPAAEPGKVIKIHRNGRTALMGSALLMSIAVALIVIAAASARPSGNGRLFDAPMPSQVILRDSTVQMLHGPPVTAATRSASAKTMEDAADPRSRKAQASPHRLGLIPASVRIPAIAVKAAIPHLGTPMHSRAPTSSKPGQGASRLLSVGLK